MLDPKHNVRYKRKGVSVSVEQIDGFGKNPGLWIGTESPNMRVKVASFGSEDKARLFIKWLDYIIGVTDDEGSVKWDV
jgi:hypothetical protein